MARYPKYYVRPDGLHETILRINGKRKAFRGKTDKEVWEKVKAFDREADRIETEKAAVFEKIADAWWSEIEPTLEHNTQKATVRRWPGPKRNLLEGHPTRSPQKRSTSISRTSPPPVPGRPW